MTKLKPKLLQILFLLFVAIAVVLYVRSRVSPPRPTGGADYNSLVPGLSSKQAAIDKLGEPLGGPDAEVLLYKSNNPNLPNELRLEENTIFFIKEIVAPSDNKTSDQIKQIYGDTNYILYGLGSGSGFALYVYPDRGIAYVGHTRASVLLEIWYFPPTTFPEFRSRWASDYTLSPIPQQ